jgi:hypothetical protein
MPSQTGWTRWLVTAAVVSACTPAQVPTSSLSPTPPPATPTSPPPTATPLPPTATVTVSPTPEPSPTTPPTTPPTPSGAIEVYRDDRSDPTSLISSYINALDQNQNARAYGYWEESPQRPAFADFAMVYTDTASAVSVQMGTILGDAGAGQFVYTVPALITFERAAEREDVVACFTLHLSNPGVQATPPFAPLGIRAVTQRALGSGEDPTAALAAACPADAGAPVEAPTPPDPADISAARYLDDRGNGVQVLRSLFNAINRREYLRAWSYWEVDSPERPDFETFSAGYEVTDVVALAIGEPVSDAGAGQIYFTVPVALRAIETDGQQRTFAGCYILHLTNPGLQAEPPFQPLAIRSAMLEESDFGDADLAAVAAEVACAP